LRSRAGFARSHYHRADRIWLLLWNVHAGSAAAAEAAHAARPTPGDAARLGGRPVARGGDAGTGKRLMARRSGRRQPGLWPAGTFDFSLGKVILRAACSPDSGATSAVAALMQSATA